jgi:hypothetical protein
MATDPTGPAPSLVTRAKNIILSPKTEWQVIDAEPATVGGLYTNYVMILAAIPALAMAIGLFLFGINLIFVTMRPSTTYIIANAITQYVGSLVGVFILALIIEALAPSFGGTKDRVQAMKVAAYSYTPAWIAGIVLLMPSLALLVLLASLYCLYLLYLGLPLLMKSAADKKGVYLAAVIVAAIVIGLIVGAVTNAVTRSFMPAPTLTAPAGYTLPG